MNFFDWEFAREILPRLLDASLTTIGIALAGFAIAVVLGLFLAIGRRSRHRWLSWPVTGLIEFIRSTPLLIQVYFLFYVFPVTASTSAPCRRGSSVSRCTTPATPPRSTAPAWTRCRARSGKRSPR